MTPAKAFTILISAVFQAIAALLILKVEKKNLTKNQKILIFISFDIVSCACGFFIPNEFRLITAVFLISLALYYLAKIKDNNVILYVFNIYMILIASESIITILFILFGINASSIMNNVYCNLFVNIAISLFAILLINLKPIKLLVNKIIDIFNNKKYLIYYLYIFLGIIYLFVLKNSYAMLSKTNYFINIFFFIGIIILFSIIIINQLKNENLKEINKQTLSYVEKYEKIITEQGKANHEFKNQLMVIKGYADMGSPKLKDYLASVIYDSKKLGSTYMISQLNKFPNGGIKGLLYYKLSLMEDKHIKYEIYSEDAAKQHAEKLSIDDMTKITKIIGVLIDNAIDATSKAQNKLISISLSYEKSVITLSVSNTFRGNIERSKIGTGFTTKGQGHGYGLRLVQDIIKDNDKFSYESRLDDKLYVSTFKISMKKSR